MLLVYPCARLFSLYFAQYLHPVWFSSFLWFHHVTYLCGCGPYGMRFLLSSGGGRWSRRGGGGVSLTVLYLFFFLFTPSPSWCWSLAIRSRGGIALSLSLSECYCGVDGCCCENYWSLVIPWLTNSANYLGGFALLRSYVASTVESIHRTLRMESASWLWLYLYFDKILWLETLISAPHVCCAANYVFASIMTVRRLLCTHTP